MNGGMVIVSLDQTSILHIWKSSPLLILPQKYEVKYPVISKK